MPTTLESLLNDDQREDLANYLETRIQSIDSQLGNLREKRKRYLAQMNDDFEFRRSGDTGGSTRDRWFANRGLDEWAGEIFDLQNDSLNIVGGFAAFMTARTVDDIFGTDPYFSIYGEGPLDKDLAEVIQKHAEWKIRRSPWRDCAIDAIDNAVGLGEGIIMQSWDREVDVFEVEKTVLFDVANRRPVQTADGQYLFDSDAYQQVSLNMDGIPVVAFLFDKAPLEPVNVANVTWKQMAIEQTNISYDNIRANTVHIDDFICAENEATIEESDFVGRRIQRRLSYLIERYELDKDTIAELSSDTYDPKTAESKPNADLREQAENYSRYDRPDPLIELVESWVRYDPIGDRRQRRMYALFAVKSKRIIRLDYIANVTPTGEIPFHAVRAFKVKNRWWGRGYYEIYEKAQEFIDRHLNYVAYRNRFHSNPVTFFDDSVLFEDEESEDMELRPGASYRLKAGFKKEDCIQILELPDLDERTWQLMQMMIQIVQVRSGITSAAQGEVSSLPSTATATGIESILQSASTLARLPMNEMKHGLEKSMLYSIKLIYANMRPEEAFTYFEGDEQKVGMLQAINVQDLEMNVRLLLTRFKQREALEAAQKGIDLMVKYYVPLPEPEKGPMRPMFVQAIKGLGFEQADSIVRRPIEQPPIDPATGLPMSVDPATGQPLALPPQQPVQQAA